MARNVGDEALLSTIIEDLLPQDAWGVEILRPDLGQEGDGLTGEVAVGLIEVDTAVAEGDGLDGGEVWWTRALVVECHVAVTLEVGHAVWDAWGVYRQLLVVDTDTVAVSVWVREETRLQHWVGGWLNTWWHVSWVKGDLLDLGEVVLDILVQVELSDLAAWKLLLRPDVSQVKDVDLLLLPQVLGLLRGHGLDFQVPSRVVALLDGVEKIFLVSIGRVAVGLGLRNEASALLGLHVELDVLPVTGLVDQLHGVARVTVHLAPVLWNTTVAHQDHDLVDGLWVLGEVVPEHSGVVSAAQVRGGVTLLSVDEVREFGWVPQEEDWSVVCDHIPVALVGPELNRETTWVSGTVVGARLTTNSGETDGDWALLSLLEDVCKADIVKRVGCLVIPVGTTTLGVYNTLGNTLAVEVGEEID